MKKTIFPQIFKSKQFVEGWDMLIITVQCGENCMGDVKRGKNWVGDVQYGKTGLDGKCAVRREMAGRRQQRENGVDDVQ